VNCIQQSFSDNVLEFIFFVKEIDKLPVWLGEYIDSLHKSDRFNIIIYIVIPSSELTTHKINNNEPNVKNVALHNSTELMRQCKLSVQNVFVVRIESEQVCFIII
jgi:hypothetical protein